VTIKGFTMRHSTGVGIKNDRWNYWRVRNNNLSYAHTVNLALSKGPGMVATGNRIHHGGQMGFASNEARVWLLNNRIFLNSTKGFDPGWEAGAMKISQTRYALIRGNNIYRNGHFGIWTDVIQEGRQRVKIIGNRVHNHRRQGIRVEITKNVLIRGNKVYNNGLRYGGDPNSGSGISLSGSYNVRAAYNVLARNRNGIVVVNVDRGSYDHVNDVRLNRNTIIQRNGKAAAWFKAVRGGNIWKESANNGGYRNRYWYPGRRSSEGDGVRYKWSGDYQKLIKYKRRGPESGSYYLTNRAMRAVLRNHNM
jgi:parallel beta-helix repeat protein